MQSSTGWWVTFFLLAATFSASAAQHCFIDLNFLVDASGSVNFKDPSNWNKTLQFIVDVVSLFTIGPNNVQVACVQYGDLASVKWDLTRYQDKASLITTIRNLRYPTDGQATNLNYALYLTRTQVFAPGRGARPNANRVTIILTDGEDTEPVKGTPLTIQNATACKNDGIRLIGIGVSDEVDTDRLLQIVSDNTTDYYHVDYFVGLTGIVDQLKPVICMSMTTFAPTTMDTTDKPEVTTAGAIGVAVPRMPVVAIMALIIYCYVTK